MREPELITRLDTRSFRTGHLPEHLAVALADHYLIERKLAEGVMRVVYPARDIKHARKGAVAS